MNSIQYLQGGVPTIGAGTDPVSSGGNSMGFTASVGASGDVSAQATGVFLLVLIAFMVMASGSLR